MAVYLLQIPGNEDFLFITNPEADQYRYRPLFLKRILSKLFAQKDVDYVEVVFDERYMMVRAVDFTFKTRIAGKMVDIHCNSVPNLQETHIPERRYMPFPFMSLSVNN